MATRRRDGESREEFNARTAKYMNERYWDRRNRLLAVLGGRCVDCGVAEQLEFDHVDQLTKSFGISRRLNSAPWNVLLAEAEKCVLRCQACHAYMTAFQRLRNFDALALASRLSLPLAPDGRAPDF
jgi:hypothetical protein